MKKSISAGLRMIAADSLVPGSPVSMLLAKPVGQKRDRVQAVNAEQSVRGRYRALKKIYARDPVERRRLDDLMGYLRVLKADPLLGDPSVSPFGEQEFQPKEESRDQVRGTQESR